MSLKAQLIALKHIDSKVAGSIPTGGMIFSSLFQV